MPFSLVWTVVLTGLSIALAIVASILSGITASDGVFTNCYSSDQNQLCNAAHFIYARRFNVHTIT